VRGDLALVLTSLVDYKHEREWALAARNRGIKVGFFGTPATHLPNLFSDAADFVLIGEPEEAASRIANGEKVQGLVKSPAINDLDALPFPQWIWSRPDALLIRIIALWDSLVPFPYIQAGVVLSIALTARIALLLPTVSDQ